MDTRIPCYLCGCAQASRRDGSVRDAPELEVLECTACGLVYLSSQAHIVSGHYEAGGMHGSTAPDIEAWRRASSADDQRRFDMLRPALANQRLLDFGCGAGGFLALASSLCSQAVGVEPDRRAREHWHGRLDIRDGVDGLVKFDLVTAFHVLEHLPDPRSALADLASHLDEGGRIVIEVPNSDDALLTLYGSEAFQRFTYWSQHLYLFNPSTLADLARQAGLEVAAIRQVQRYPLSNHLHWLAKRSPGGHLAWSFLDAPGLAQAYADTLAAMGKCDTLVAHLHP